MINTIIYIDSVLYWPKYILFFFEFLYVSFKLTDVVIFHTIVRIIMAIDEPTPLMFGQGLLY